MRIIKNAEANKMRIIRKEKKGYAVMLKRKIYDALLSWKKKYHGTKVILIEGARCLGKSTVCEEFGRREYKSCPIIDFARVSA